MNQDDVDSQIKATVMAHADVDRAVNVQRLADAIDAAVLIELREEFAGRTVTSDEFRATARRLLDTHHAALAQLAESEERRGGVQPSSGRWRTNEEE